MRVIIEFAEARPWAGSLRYDGSDVDTPFVGRLDLLRLLEPLTDPGTTPSPAHPGPQPREQR